VENGADYFVQRIGNGSDAVTIGGTPDAVASRMTF